MMAYLNIGRKVFFDDRVIRKEVHSHFPYYSTSYGYNDEIRIPISQQDVCTLPAESYIYIEGETTGIAAGVTGFVDSNGILALFSEIRYEICGIEIDRSRNPGITSSMKNYISFSENEHENTEHTGWDPFTATPNQNIVSGTKFNACIPLKYILGFAEDYQNILINVKQELILRRSNHDKNLFFLSAASDTAKVDIKKIIWKVPYVYMSDNEKIKILKHIQHDSSIEIAFRSWDLYEYPILPTNSKKEIWNIKTSTNMEKPRYLIFGFQTGRCDDVTKMFSKFDHSSFRNIKVFLNSEFFPYESLEIDFLTNKYTVLFEMFSKFRNSYYENNSLNSGMRMELFKEYSPLVVIDCSKQNEYLKSGTVDVKVEIESNDNFNNKTTLYCLILHDRIATYSPLSNIVKILI